MGNARDMDTRQLIVRKGLTRNGDPKPSNTQRQGNDQVQRLWGMGKRNGSQYPNKETGSQCHLKHPRPYM